MNEAKWRKRKWTDKQIEKLRELWGYKSYREIARLVGHTETAVRLKAKRMRLGPVKDAAEYLCAREIARIMGIDSHVVSDYWIKKLDLPHKRISSEKRTLWVLVQIEDLMKFLREHQDIWDSRRVEIYALGSEPEWLHKKRIQDRKKWDDKYEQKKGHYKDD